MTMHANLLFMLYQIQYFWGFRYQSRRKFDSLWLLGVRVKVEENKLLINWQKKPYNTNKMAKNLKTTIQSIQ